MIAFVCTPPSIRITLRVAMVTMQFRKAQMSLYFGLPYNAEHQAR